MNEIHGQNEGCFLRTLNAGCAGCAVVIAILGLLMLIGMCMGNGH